MNCVSDLYDNVSSVMKSYATNAMPWFCRFLECSFATFTTAIKAMLQKLLQSAFADEHTPSRVITSSTQTLTIET